MKTFFKYLSISLGLLFVGMLSSCEEERYQSLENLCHDYWIQPSDSASPIMRFDLEGNVHYFLYRYDSGDGLCYAWNDTELDGKYAIDTKNSRFCLLPDGWYDIYILSPDTFTLDNGEGGNIKMSNLSADKITILTESEFKQKYPDTEDETQR